MSFKIINDKKIDENVQGSSLNIHSERIGGRKMYIESYGLSNELF